MHKIVELVSLKVAGVPETPRCFWLSHALVLPIANKIVGICKAKYRESLKAAVYVSLDHTWTSDKLSLSLAKHVISAVILCRR